MFHHYTSILLSEANRYLQSKVSASESPISFSILGNSSIESKFQRPIIMRLVDITSIELCSNRNEYVPQGDGFIVRKKPESFSLSFLFSTDYEDVNALKNLELLACVAAFFQHKSFFDICNTPILQEVGIENFSVELVKMTASDKAKLWKSLHIPYSPSLLYKVGLVFIEDTTMGLKMTSAFSSRDN